jgi:colanic acid/amylovoran biosynthesis glycosyltransferase
VNIMSDRRGRVALFSTNFLEYSQTFVYDELVHHRRYEVEVFARNRTNHDSFPHPRVNSLAPTRSLAGKLEALLYATTTYSPSHRRKLEDGCFDLLHAHFGPGSIYALPYQRALRLPLVVTYHGYDVPLLSSPRRLRPKYWRYWLRSGAMLKRVTRFLAASNELRDMLIELGAAEDRVRVWRLGVRIPELAPPERSGKNVLMVGRFVEKKGFEYGIRAFARATTPHDGAMLHIVGDGPLRATYDAIVAELDISDRVRFLGILSHEDVLRTMEAMDMLIACSVVAKNGDRESGLLVAKEAGARGLPVIGTHHGGIPEIVDDGETGFLVPERDVDALASRLTALFSDPSLATRLGTAARRKMQREYDITARVEELEAHYDEAIAQHRAQM